MKFDLVHSSRYSFRGNDRHRQVTSTPRALRPLKVKNTLNVPNHTFQSRLSPLSFSLSLSLSLFLTFLGSIVISTSALIMFFLAELRDIVCVTACDMNKPFLSALRDELHRRYANKVLLDLGRVVCITDILHADTSIIHPGQQGASHTPVFFQILVFKPFQNEILTAQVIHEDEFGIRASLGFFDDIFIAHELLQSPSSYDPDLRCWVWDFNGNQLFIDVGDTIRCRVESVSFTQPKIQGLSNAESISSTSALGAGGKLAVPTSSSPTNLPAPMMVKASMSEPGLGVASWWTADGGPLLMDEVMFGTGAKIQLADDLLRPDFEGLAGSFFSGIDSAAYVSELGADREDMVSSTRNQPKHSTPSVLSDRGTELSFQSDNEMEILKPEKSKRTDSLPSKQRGPSGKKLSVKSR